ncbi:MAG: hypothetical protein O6947_07680, partial [Acidobacteria bacterium]|nr:hypothetical protein [Acidobacteriota bacterium]
HDLKLVGGLAVPHSTDNLPAILHHDDARVPVITRVVRVSIEDQIDTAGVAVLLVGLLLARKQNVKYFLCAPSESVLRVFRLARLGEALDCCCRGPEEVEQRLKSSAGAE